MREIERLKQAEKHIYPFILTPLHILLDILNIHEDQPILEHTLFLTFKITMMKEMIDFRLTFSDSQGKDWPRWYADQCFEDDFSSK